MKNAVINREDTFYDNEPFASLDSAVKTQTNILNKEALKSKLYSIGLGVDMMNYSKIPNLYGESGRKNVAPVDDAKMAVVNLYDISWDSSNISNTIPKKKKKEIIRPISIETEFLGTGEFAECFSVNNIYSELSLLLEVGTINKKKKSAASARYPDSPDVVSPDAILRLNTVHLDIPEKFDSSAIKNKSRSFLTLLKQLNKRQKAVRSPCINEKKQIFTSRLVKLDLPQRTKEYLQQPISKRPPKPQLSQFFIPNYTEKKSLPNGVVDILPPIKQVQVYPRLPKLRRTKKGTQPEKKSENLQLVCLNLKNQTYCQKDGIVQNEPTWHATEDMNSIADKARQIDFTNDKVQKKMYQRQSAPFLKKKDAKVIEEKIQASINEVETDQKKNRSTLEKEKYLNNSIVNLLDSLDLEICGWNK